MKSYLTSKDLMEQNKHLYADFDSYVDPFIDTDYDYRRLSDDEIRSRFYYVHPEALGNYPEGILYESEDGEECHRRVMEDKTSLKRKFYFEANLRKKTLKRFKDVKLKTYKKELDDEYNEICKEIDDANEYNTNRAYELLQEIKDKENELLKLKNPTPLTKIEKIKNVISDDSLKSEVSKYMRKYISEDKTFSLYESMVDRLRAINKDTRRYAGIENKFEGPEDFYDWIYNTQDTYRATKGKGPDMKRFEYQLDKDLLGTTQGKNYYSRETCLFIPKYINTMLEARNASRGDLPLGVARGREPGERAKLRNPNLKYYSVYISVLGYASHHMMIRSCDNMHVAFWIYKLCKEYYVRRIGSLFLSRGLITREVYLALNNFEVKDDSGLANPTEQDKKEAINWIERKELYNKIENALQNYSVKVVDEMRRSVIRLDPLDHENIMECLHKDLF